METVRRHRGNECPCPGASSRGHPSLRSILPDSQKGQQQAVAGLHYHSYPEHRQSLGSTITATLKHIAAFLHLLLLLTRAAAWLLQWSSGRRLGHVCMGCNPPGLAHCQPYSSQDQAAQNWPKLSGSPK